MGKIYAMHKLVGLQLFGVCQVGVLNSCFQNPSKSSAKSAVLKTCRFSPFLKDLIIRFPDYLVLTLCLLRKNASENMALDHQIFGPKFGPTIPNAKKYVFSQFQTKKFPNLVLKNLEMYQLKISIKTKAVG